MQCYHLQLHDFGYRGSTSVESAALGGAAHLVNFQVRVNSVFYFSNCICVVTQGFRSIYTCECIVKDLPRLKSFSHPFLYLARHGQVINLPCNPSDPGGCSTMTRWYNQSVNHPTSSSPSPSLFCAPEQKERFLVWVQAYLFNSVIAENESVGMIVCKCTQGN